MKKVKNLFICMVQIEISSFSFLLSIFAFLDDRNNSMGYHTDLIPELLKDNRFLFSLLLAIVFALTSLISFSKYSKHMEKGGFGLLLKQKGAIILISALLPLLFFVVIILLALFFAPIEKTWAKVLLWLGYFAFFIIINLSCSSKLLRWLENDIK